MSVPFVVELECAVNALYEGLVSCMILSTVLFDFAPDSVMSSACMPCSVICSISDRNSAPPSVISLCRTLSVAMVMVATHASWVWVNMTVPAVFPSVVAWVGDMRSASSKSLSRQVGVVCVLLCACVSLNCSCWYVWCGV